MNVDGAVAIEYYALVVIAISTGYAKSPAAANISIYMIYFLNSSPQRRNNA
jgi:hypothetical protein